MKLRIPFAALCAALITTATPAVAASAAPTAKRLPVVYTVEVLTGKSKQASTTGIVSLSMHGTLRSTGFMLLDNGEPNFRSGSRDTFEFELGDLENISAVSLRLCSNPRATSWYLEKVVITNQLGTEWVFPYYAWVSAPKRQCAIAGPIPVA